MAKSRSKNSRQPVKKSPVKKSARQRQTARRGAGPRRAKTTARKPAATAPKGQWVYAFGDGKAEGRAAMRNLLGGKGADLAEMAQSRPAGAARLHHHHRGLHLFLRPRQNLSAGAEAAGRGGARRRRPHHRQEIRRRAKSAAGLGALRRARLDAGHDGHGAQSRPQRRDGRGAGGEIRRPPLRLRQLPPLHHDVFRRRARRRAIIISRRSSTTYKERQGYTLDTDLTADDWAEIVERYKERVEEETGKPFPQDPHEQLWGAIGAVFGSWMNQRAITYRRLHNIPESWGTAVNVQAMVFGNMGETSATGVAFTRNPSTGEKKLYGEFLINAQGEDVVAGIRTPQEITEAGAPRVRLRQAVDGRGDAGGLCRAQAHLRRARDALPRHAGHRVHRRAGQAVDAADPQRQAHRQGGAEHRRRPRQRRADHARRRR